MGARSVLEAVRNLGGKATLTQIYAYLAERERKPELSDREKHRVRSTIYSLKKSKKLTYHGASTYVLWPDA